MLAILDRVEQQLPRLLANGAAWRWRSVFVNYHPPFVERIWIPWNTFRITLHRILPCETGQALFHPHPWPSAVKILSGCYEMGVGYESGTTPPPVASRLLLTAGSSYEMIEPDGWHWVRPIAQPVFSVMVTGVPWNRPSPKSEQPLDRLSSDQKRQLIEFFEKYYDVS